MQLISTDGGHPYLVNLRESFICSAQSSSARGLLCIVMDYCDGGDLEATVRTARLSRAGFGEEQVRLWLLQLLSAVDFLHSRSLMHRDIKPANVFMHRGACMLGDLGLSKQVLSHMTTAQAHTQCGSPLFLAPEVHMGRPYESSVDIWAVGCVLFELMMLDHAFQGRGNHQILQNVRERAAKALSAASPVAPPPARSNHRAAPPSTWCSPAQPAPPCRLLRSSMPSTRQSRESGPRRWSRCSRRASRATPRTAPPPPSSWRGRTSTTSPREHSTPRPCATGRQP